MKKEKINTLVISDIHLNSEHCQTNKVLEVLNKYDFERFIINGDLFSHDTSKPFSDISWKVVSTLRDLAKNKDFIFVKGNHDEGSDKFVEAIGAKSYRKYKFEVNNRRYISVHGCIFDSWIGDAPWICKKLFGFYYWLVKVDTSGSVPRWMKRRSNSWKESAVRVTRNALNFFSSNRVDYILLGHTHHQSSVYDNFKTAFNVGCFCDSLETGYLTIDEHGCPQLHKA